MSAFPRKVLDHQYRIARYSNTFRRLFIGGFMISPVAGYALCEYNGWLKRFDPPDPNSPEAYIFTLWSEDSQSRQFLKNNFGFVIRTTAKIEASMQDAFGAGPNLTGIKQFAQDPENKEPEAITSTNIVIGDMGSHKTLAYTSSKTKKVDDGGDVSTTPSTSPPLSQSSSSQETASSS
eukprot:TRINITY_DN2682_c0_g1_i7.p1 TRINITY_DN2682_c0_g1~~TRINITY_DN2682_c0_g1_i7.p1  ORF type:complete len:178 (-),score=27.18 TRINITY_DN2682_c0_g1_i7:225-758(-)